jgi:hypothetical protein
LVTDTESEGGIRLTTGVVETVKTSTKTNVEVDGIAAVGVVVSGENTEAVADIVVLGENTEAVVEVVFAYGPDMVVVDGMVLLRPVLFGAYPELMKPVPSRGGSALSSEP